MTAYSTAYQFRQEFSIFSPCEYNNLISLHLMFTKVDMFDNQLVLTTYRMTSSVTSYMTVFGSNFAYFELYDGIKA